MHFAELQPGICPKSQKERETSMKIPNWALSDIDGYQRVLFPQHQMLLIVVTCHVITLVDIYCDFTGYCQALGSVNYKHYLILFLKESCKIGKSRLQKRNLDKKSQGLTWRSSTQAGDSTRFTFFSKVQSLGPLSTLSTSISVYFPPYYPGGTLI